MKIEREIERTAAVHKEKKPVDKPINPFSLFIWKWIGETLCGRSQVSLNQRWKHKNGKKSAALLLKIFQQYFILMKPHHPLTMLLAYIAIEWNFLLANYSVNIVRHLSTANVWIFFFISVHSFDAHWTGPNPCLKLSTHSSPGCFERFHRWCFLAIMLQFSLCHSNNIRNVWNLRVFELILERHFDISQSIIR